MDLSEVESEETMTPEPRTGMIFECIKGNAKHSAVKGKFYVYDRGELRTYTTRNVTVLLNGDEMLALPGCFLPAERCPFCGYKIYDRETGWNAVFNGETGHLGVECAAEWDARVKGYERE